MRFLRELYSAGMTPAACRLVDNDQFRFGRACAFRHNSASKHTDVSTWAHITSNALACFVADALKPEKGTIGQIGSKLQKVRCLTCHMKRSYLERWLQESMPVCYVMC